MHTSDHPADLGILAASRQLRRRALSAVELLEACEERIASRNGGPPSFDGAPDAVNAWARLYPEAARAQARAADARRAAEDDAAPALCGIPLALKDLFAVAGLPLTASSRVLEGNVAGGDSTAWRRLAGEGMVLLGHAHTHEFAAGGTTDQVGNPWALELVAGGSSGGSAAAVAAGMAPAALGTDTCGSLRIPSACCGTSTIKPTRGSVPLDGVIPLAPTLDHAGPIARSVADASALLAALTGRFAPVSARPGPRPLAGVRVAVSGRLDALEHPPAVADALALAASACERLGAELVALHAPAATDWADLTCVLLSEVWAYHVQHTARAELYRPAIAELVQASRTFTDAQAYIAAQQRRGAFARAWDEHLRTEDIDAVLEPTLCVLPGPRGHGYDPGHAGGQGDPMIELTAPWNLTGMPVVALPVTPHTGVSLIGRRGSEVRLIQAAIDLQEHGLGRPDFAALGAAAEAV